jgi:hypothetical protein
VQGESRVVFERSAADGEITTVAEREVSDAERAAGRVTRLLTVDDVDCHVYVRNSLVAVAVAVWPSPGAWGFFVPVQ